MGVAKQNVQKLESSGRREVLCVVGRWPKFVGNMMNLLQWQKICGEVVAQRNPLRLDCLNPFSALAKWRLIDNQHQCQASALSTVPVDIAAKYRPHPVGTYELEQGFRATLDLPDRNCVLTKGVRSLLRTLMNSSTGKSYEWFLPSDVYPAYQSIAGDAGIRFTTYSTWPDIRLDALLSQSSMDNVFLLLPVPHSPTGQLPSAEEVGLLLEWTSQSRSRFLLLDLVYAYDHIKDPRLRQLAECEQTILAFSTSKTWLQRCLAGIAILPQALTKELQASSEMPDEAARGLAISCLEEQKTLPARQAARFQQQWQLLTEQLRDADQFWTAPAIGYLSIINCSWQTMLDRHNLLAVPPSLFSGELSDRPDELRDWDRPHPCRLQDYSIVSCLNNIDLEQSNGY